MKCCFLLALLLVAPLHAETVITWKRVQLTDKFYSEGANAADINKDGKMDIISGPFWYEGPNWEKKHAFYEPKEFNIVGYSDNFFAYPHDFNADTAPEAVELYRDVLEKQPDNSVVIAKVGYLTNIGELLQLPAEEGRLSGMELVKRKVKQWVCMGGNFIGYPPKDDLKLSNVNFFYDSIASYYAIRHWPKDIVFAGREVCSVPSGLAIGEHLSQTPTNNPVRRAYELYFNGQPKNRHVADLATVLFAVRGLRDYWDIETNGYMDIHPDMTFEWRFDKDSNQSYLKKKTRDGKPNDRYVESVLDALLIKSPVR